MSLNKFGGLTLPSFTNVKPTVGLSNATTVIASSNSDQSEDQNLLPLTEHTAEGILHNEVHSNFQEAHHVENPSTLNESVQIAQTTPRESLHSDKECMFENTADNKEQEHISSGLEKPLSKKTSIAESSEEDLKVLEEFDDHSATKNTHNFTDKIEVSTTQNEKVSNLLNLSPSSLKSCKNSLDNRDIISDDDDSIDEKVGLYSEEPPQLTQEEKLINETLVDDDNNTQSIEEKEISKEVEEEIEKKVHKIRSMSNTDAQNNHLKETITGKLERLSTTESIKTTLSLPPDLRKQEPFDFQSFLTQFKSKDCEPVHKYLKSFLTQFNQKIWSIEEQIKIVSEFEDFLFNKLIDYKPFNEINKDQNAINNCKEGLEKLVMTKVYTSVYSPTISYIRLTDAHRNDKQMDRKYLVNCYLYDWIEPNHLDLDIKVDIKHIALVKKELSAINEFKSPRDKIVCILNACKILFNLIRQNLETQENADSFVPLLIYVLVKSKIKNLYSNLKYIERFRNNDLLVGETSYYLSTLQISVNFIINISKDKLTIDEHEYEDKIIRSKKKLREMQTGIVSEESPSQVLTKSAEMVKQSLANSFNTLIQNIVPGDDVQDEINAGHERHSASGTEMSDLERARLLSLEEEERKRLMKAQLKELSEMFPNLDMALIEDVYEACDRDVARAVDTLLSL